jgi:hypothetical protein
MYPIYQRTREFPRIPYRGFLFIMTLLPDRIADLQIVRVSDIVEAE